ncbi:MAG: hypothetical protein GY817_03920 [bacterium]|nr:hypothetical protein [bacterium]
MKIDKTKIQPCPKHKKHTACSGVVDGMCEVNYSKYCIFYLMLLKKEKENAKTKIK